MGRAVRVDGIIPKGSLKIKTTYIGCLAYSTFIGIGIKENAVEAYVELDRAGAQVLADQLLEFIGDTDE